MHLKLSLARCDILDKIFQKTSKARFCKTLQSVSIWFIDKTKNNKDDDFSKKKYYFYFYLFGVIGIFIIAIDSLIRILFKERVKNNGSAGNCEFGYVSFADSHESVFSRIKRQCAIEGRSSINISAKPIGKLFSKKNNFQNIDNFVSLVNLIKQVKNSVVFLKSGRRETIDFLVFNGKNISASDFMIFSIKIFQSIRFKIWSNSFFKRNSFDYIFLGNDTCYRAYWLINNPKSGKSVTIQHGIPENIIQYYSISDYFVYWDSISFDNLHKNKAVKYISGGYPKEQLILSGRSGGKSGLITICTKFQNSRELELMEKFALIMHRANISFEVKFHPLETTVNKKKLFKIAEYSGKIKEIGEFAYVAVIDSTFAIDLVMSKREIIPLSFKSKNSFGDYFESMSVESFLKKIEALDGSEIRNFLYSMQNCMPNMEFLRFKTLEKSLDINGTLV